MKNRTGRIAIIAVTLAVAAMAVWFAIRPPAAECVVLETGRLQNTFTEMGEVIPESEASLYTKTGGRLSAVHAREGAPVNKGELLFVFDDSEIKNEEEGALAEIAVLDSQIRSRISALDIQKNALESDNASLLIKIEQAAKEEQRMQTEMDSAEQLYEAGAAAAQDVDKARAAYALTAGNKALLEKQLAFTAVQLSVINAEIREYNNAQGSAGGGGANRQQELLARKDASQAQLHLLREKLDETEITAPQEGIIRESSFKEGQVVPPGTKLCSIYQPDRYRIECYILVENTEGVHVGDTVEITLRLRDGDKKMQGIIIRKALDAVERISKVGLSEKRIKVEVTMEEDGWAGLGPYWPVELRFITAQADHCLLAPKTALFTHGDDRWKVWVVRDGRVRALEVERGIQTPSQVEIRSGLQPGDVIIKNAKTSTFAEGESVRVVK